MIAHLARLVRPRLCLLATAATACGYLMARPAADTGLFLVLAGAFLLAAGCSTINQAQERRRDAMMSRTAARPMASRRLGLAAGTILGLAFLAAALPPLALLDGSGPVAVLLIVVVLYNGLYTPLKTVTPFAILVGGLAGAMPPWLGWTAAGGDPLDFRVVACGLVMYLWQVPHFWYLVEAHRRDYLAAGFRVPAAFRHDGRPSRRAVAWLAAYFVAMLLAPAFSLVGARAGLGLLAAQAGCGLILWGSRAGGGRKGLAAINVSLILFLAVLTADALWRAAT